MYTNELVLRPCRAGGGPQEVPPLLVHLRPPLPGVGVQPLLAEGEAAGEHHGDGPLPGPGHHRVHRPQHALHGHGALPHDRRVQRHAQHRKPGESEAWWTGGGGFK